MDEFVLRTDRLTKLYGDKPAVDSVTMCIRRGDIYGFVGRNGAGKTTLMRIVCGLIRQSGGEYTLLGERDGGRGIEGVRRRVGAIIEAPALFPSFTAEQNLKMRCMAVGADESVVPRALEQAGLGGTGGKKVKDFSLGMRQRLGIATALLGDPEFLILDEPVNGLDPQGIVEVRELLLRLNRERGLTVLVSSHILGELSRLAGRFGFIEHGRLLREISAAELEEACGRRLVLHMNGIVRFGEAMEKLGVRKFRAVSPTVCEVETDLSVSALAFALREVGLEILRVAEKEADLEGYFMRLIGGEEV